MKNGAKVQTFIQLRKSSILYEWLWMVRGAATEKYGCANASKSKYKGTGAGQAERQRMK